MSQYVLGSLLCNAVYNGDIEKVRSTIYKGASVNSYSEAYYRSSCNYPLNWAIEKNHVDIVEILIDEGADINKSSAVQLAISKNNFEIFKILISRGGDVHLNDGSALKDLIDRQRVDWLQYLLNSRTNIDKMYLDRTTPLLFAVRKKNIEMTKWLLENGAKNFILKALLMAYKNGSWETVPILLEHLPKIKQIEVLKKILQVGAKTRFKNHVIKKVLNIFLELDDKELTKILVSDSNADGHAALLFGCIKNKNINGVKALVECGINLNITSECGQTPLTLSVLMNNYDLVEYFMEKELKIDETDKNGDNTLIVAARKNDFKFVDFLISRGADLEKVNDQMQELAKNNDNLAIYLDNIKLDGQKPTQTTTETDAVPLEEEKSEQDGEFSSNQE